MRNLVVILGDQLHRGSAVFEGFEPSQDQLWMAECAGEARHVWSHKARIVMFLAAMRHFRQELLARGWPLRYRALEQHGHVQLIDALREDIRALKPRRLLLVRPGEWRLRHALQQLAQQEGLDYAERPDRHFCWSPTSSRNGPARADNCAWSRSIAGCASAVVC